MLLRPLVSLSLFLCAATALSEISVPVADNAVKKETFLKYISSAFDIYMFDTPRYDNPAKFSLRFKAKSNSEHMVDANLILSDNDEKLGFSLTMAKHTMEPKNLHKLYFNEEFDFQKHSLLELARRMVYLKGDEEKKMVYYHTAIDIRSLLEEARVKADPNLEIQVFYEPAENLKNPAQSGVITYKAIYAENLVLQLDVKLVDFVEVPRDETKPLEWSWNLDIQAITSIQGQPKLFSLVVPAVSFEQSDLNELAAFIEVALAQKTYTNTLDDVYTLVNTEISETTKSRPKPNDGTNSFLVKTEVNEVQVTVARLENTPEGLSEFSVEMKNSNNEPKSLVFMRDTFESVKQKIGSSLPINMYLKSIYQDIVQNFDRLSTELVLPRVNESELMDVSKTAEEGRLIKVGYKNEVVLDYSEDDIKITVSITSRTNELKNTHTFTKSKYNGTQVAAFITTMLKLHMKLAYPNAEML